MTRATALRNARELFLAGKHRMFGMLMVPDLIDEATDYDENLGGEVLKLLDECTPSKKGGRMMFSVWADGGDYCAPEDATGLTDGDVGIVHRYDRTEAEIAAVFGKACVIAAREP